MWVRPGEPFYDNKVESTNITWHSFNVDFFSNNNHRERILWKQNIFFTFLSLIFILNVVVADHRAAVREGEVHTGICSLDHGRTVSPPPCSAPYRVWVPTGEGFPLGWAATRAA